MKCPFCQIEYFDNAKTQFSFSEPLVENVGNSRGVLGYLSCNVIERKCPSCGKTNISMRRYNKGGAFQPLTVVSASDLHNIERPINEEILLYPRYAISTFPSVEIPPHILKDFIEAGQILHDSPNASAALSRRCLQTILREKAKVSPSELYYEIQEILERKDLPSYLNDSIDSIRKVGNIAAHSLKSKSSGSIIDVEPLEADLSINVLEGLIDFYYILPERQKARIVKVNEKYDDAEKKPKKVE